jgi:predicted nucleic acid-binding protein
VICLDNSVLSRFASSAASPSIDDYLAAHSSEPWTIPATVAFEYYSYFETRGEIRRQQRKLNSVFDGILPATDEVAAEAAQIRASLAVRDVTLDPADLLHVATAREAGATFVTRDVEDFDAEPIRDLLDIALIRS